MNTRWMLVIPVVMPFLLAAFCSALATFGSRTTMFELICAGLCFVIMGASASMIVGVIRAQELRIAALESELEAMPKGTMNSLREHVATETSAIDCR